MRSRTRGENQYGTDRRINTRGCRPQGAIFAIPGQLDSAQHERKEIVDRLARLETRVAVLETQVQDIRLTLDRWTTRFWLLMMAVLACLLGLIGNLIVSVSRD